MQKLTSILFAGAGEYQRNWILRILDQEKKNIRVNKKEFLNPRGQCKPLRDEGLGHNTRDMKDLERKVQNSGR